MGGAALLLLLLALLQPAAAAVYPPYFEGLPGLGWIPNVIGSGPLASCPAGGTGCVEPTVLDTSGTKMAVDGDLKTTWDCQVPGQGAAPTDCAIVFDLQRSAKLVGFALWSEGEGTGPPYGTHDCETMTLAPGEKPTGPFTKPQTLTLASSPAGRHRNVFSLKEHHTARYWEFSCTKRFSAYQLYLTEIIFRVSSCSCSCS